MRKSAGKENNAIFNLRNIIIGLALLLLFFAAGVRFSPYLYPGNESAALPEYTAAEDTNAVWVDVKGAVMAPGVYPFPEGSRVEDALAVAGLAPDAAPELLNRAAFLYDGSELIVSFQNGDIDWNALASVRSGAYYYQESGASLAAGEEENIYAGKRININTASLSELESLAGIGATKAAAIIDYRETYGDFVTKEQIMNVSGIGEATFEKIKARIYVD